MNHLEESFLIYDLIIFNEGIFLYNESDGVKFFEIDINDKKIKNQREVISPSKQSVDVFEIDCHSFLNIIAIK